VERLKYSIFIYLILLLFLSPSLGFSEPSDIKIKADKLYYDQKNLIYHAEGNVEIEKNSSKIKANEITYNESSSEVTATGSVVYIDEDTFITAEKAELNLEQKTGKLYNASILFVKDNYHIYGKFIEKRGEDYYFSPESTFTTCDAPVPAWCFSGKDIHAKVGEELKAKDVKFKIKNMPVLYSPYFRSAILMDRKTGFLLPSIGYSNEKGFYLSSPFFWAISENRDLTLNIDYYSNRGFGEGLEYRYLDLGGAKGKAWFYHLSDRELSKDFFEFKMIHDQRKVDGLSSFLNINLINHEEFYREFNTNIEIRSNRFLESTGEISLPYKNTRFYALSQYWIDMKEMSLPESQKLPEIGFFTHPIRIKDALFSVSSSFSNFWKEEGIHGQRFDIYPRVFFEYGKDITISQSFGLRESYYILQDVDTENNPHRESLQYNVIVNTRFQRNYDSFMHVVEPSISYNFILNSKDNLYLFDSTELFRKKSLIELSLLNRLFTKDSQFVVFKVSEGYDSYNGDRPFQPLRIEVGFKKPFSLRFEYDYDFYEGRTNSLNSDLGLSFNNVSFYLSQRYNETLDISYYRTGLGLQPFKSLYLSGAVWYDSKEKKVKDTSITLQIVKQCWAFLLNVNNRPGEFNVSFLIELKGLTRNVLFK